MRASLCFILLTLVLLVTANISSGQENPRAVLLLEHEKPSSWNGMLRDGFEKACKANGFDASVMLAKAGANQKAIFGEAAENADLVVLASDSLHETLRDNAARFRRVKFGAIDAGIRASNIMCATFADEQAACLAGNAAAMLAEKLYGKGAMPGWLSGEDSPAMRSLYNGFVEGAKLANPDARVVQALAGSFDDEKGAAEKARQLLSQGARVIVLAAGGGNSAAAKALAGSDVWLVPLDDHLEQGNVLGWLVRRPDLAARDIVAAAAKNFRGKEIVSHDLSDGYISFSLAQNLAMKDRRLYENISRRVRELRDEIMSGSLRLPSLRQRTLCDCLD